MRYKILLVPFPFEGMQVVKVRPALCLTEPVGEFEQVVVAFITSRTDNADAETDILLTQAQGHLKPAGLKTDSAIRLHKLLTLSKANVKKVLGQLPESQLAAVQLKLLALFNLTDKNDYQ